MTQNTVHTRATRAQLREALRKIPQAMLGAHGAKNIADAMMVRCGLAALGRIKAAFVVKSRDGTDEAGERWQPLSPKTVAYSRRHPGLPKAEARAAKRPSYMLTAKQRKRWWEVYAQGLAMFRGDKGNAARRAWGILKSEGATTIFDKYGSVQVDILRDTGLLLNSLSPGVASKDQVFRIGQGEVVVGTNRKHAASHHNGVPGRIPQRRLWPAPRDWPANWWADITDQAKQGMADIAAFLIKRAKK